MADPVDRAGARLIVDLDALRDNWRRLKARLAPGADIAAVVKADGYGLGADRVVPALLAEGCATFFVATADEALAVRALSADAEILVLDGSQPGAEADFAAARLVPVLNDLAAIERWAAQARTAGTPLAAAIHVDTGMCRLGLGGDEVARLSAEPGRLDGLAPRLLLSHLACAEIPEHPMNAAQRARFLDAAARLPAMPRSLANSSGIFLAPDYHFDMVRPGAALYGISPRPAAPNPMREVVRLQGRIVAVHDVDTSMTVGYGATHRVNRRGRIATVPVGYADGLPCALGNAGHAAVVAGGADNRGGDEHGGDGRANDGRGNDGRGKGLTVPVVGRVSMDLITLDVTDLPRERAHVGAWVDLIGGGCPLDDVAGRAGTIGYEILVRLGHRIPRLYRDGGASSGASGGAQGSAA